MNTILLGLWAGLVGHALVSSMYAEELNAQQRAVVSFPDVGRAGSSLNTRFLELYRRAVAEKSDVLADPDWPVILTRKAAAQLADEPLARSPSPTPVPVTLKSKLTAGKSKLPPIASAPPSERLLSPIPPELQGTKDFPAIRLVPLKLYVPSADPPDFTTRGLIGELSIEWQKRMSHRVTVPSQLFTDGVTLPEEMPSTLGPGFWRRVGQYFRAVQKRNESSLRSMMTSEAQNALTLEGLSVGNRRPAECTVQMVAEIESMLVVFWRDRTSVQPPLVLVAQNGDYVVGTVRTLADEHQRLLRDMFWFLVVNPPKAMLARDK